jgi:hypothetical protein
LHSAARRSTPALLVACLLLALALPAQGFVVPAEGQCPPYPVRPGGEDAPPGEDVVPPLLPPGTVLDLDGAPRLEGFLPREVWERRELFFYEGMQLEVGPSARDSPSRGRASATTTPRRARSGRGTSDTAISEPASAGRFGSCTSGSGAEKWTASRGR